MSGIVAGRSTLFAPRKAVKEFSAKSRPPMLSLVAALNAMIQPQFVTLTYPHEWDNDPSAWKSDLDTFGKWEWVRVLELAESGETGAKERTVSSP